MPSFERYCCVNTNVGSSSLRNWSHSALVTGDLTTCSGVHTSCGANGGGGGGGSDGDADGGGGGGGCEGELWMQ